MIAKRMTSVESEKDIDNNPIVLLEILELMTWIWI